MGARFRKFNLLHLAAWFLLVATHATAASVTARVMDGNQSPVEHAVVYAVSPEPAAMTGKGREVLINQSDREFEPFVTVVQAGATVRFPNKDAMRHHVYSFSPAKTFQIKLDSNTAATPVIFDKTGMVPLGCNIHDWMEAYVLVVETPHFSRTNAQGAATLANVAQGSYELRVWHPYLRIAAAPQPLAVKSEGRIEALFRVELNVPRRKPKPPLDKEAY